MTRMRSACVAGLGLMVCLAAAVMAADAPPEGFEALFNGKDLANFKASDAQKKQWVIKEDGTLEFNPTGKRGEMTLWTEKEFADFTLAFDWKWVGPAQKIQRPHLDPATGEEKKDASGKVMNEEVLEYDSGIYVRGNSKSQINLWNWPCGSGEVYGYRTDKNQPQEVRAGVTPKKKMDKPLGEWNHMEITMKGDRLTVQLNGEEVISSAQLPKVPSKGALAFQDHGQGFALKNIYIKELK
jgi:hypothetical protein